MDSGLIVLLTHVAMVLILFAAVGFYKQYTGKEWDDFDGLLILIWPMTVCVWIAAFVCHGFIRSGAVAAAWIKARG